MYVSNFYSILFFFLSNFCHDTANNTKYKLTRAIFFFFFPRLKHNRRDVTLFRTFDAVPVSRHSICSLLLVSYVNKLKSTISLLKLVSETREPMVEKETKRVSLL